jgi:hypothetical protein
MTARIYVVEEAEGVPERLIEATNGAHAIRHATQPFKARLATQSDLVRLIREGVEVEKAE